MFAGIIRVGRVGGNPRARARDRDLRRHIDLHGLLDLQLRRDVDRLVQGSVDGTPHSEDLVGPLRRVHLLRRDPLEGHDDVDSLEHEYAVLDLDFPDGIRGQEPATCADLARLQRATKGTEQSTAGGGDDVIDRRRVRLGNVAPDAVVPRDRAVSPEAHRL